jgi:hypothetical protein
MDELFLVVGRTTPLGTLMGARRTTQGVIELSVQMKRRVNESSFDPTLTISGERDAMVSHNACRVLLRYYAGIIALLFKGTLHHTTTVFRKSNLASHRIPVENPRDQCPPGASSSSYCP